MLAAKVVGEQELIKKLNKLSRGEIKTAVYKALRRGTDMIRGEAKRRAPIDTGRLRFSITARTWEENLTGVVYCDYPKNTKNSKKTGKPRYYAPFVEYGTRKIAARPFLKPALRAKKKQALELVMKALEVVSK